jgi:hypothetical protein
MKARYTTTSFGIFAAVSMLIATMVFLMAGGFFSRWDGVVTNVAAPIDGHAHSPYFCSTWPRFERKRTGLSAGSLASRPARHTQEQIFAAVHHDGPSTGRSDLPNHVEFSTCHRRAELLLTAVCAKYGGVGLPLQHRATQARAAQAADTHGPGRTTKEVPIEEGTSTSPKPPAAVTPHVRYRRNLSSARQ